MNDAEICRQPKAVRAIVFDTEAMSFGMISEAKVGSLLAALAASKPAGQLLELGTGTGHGTVWISVLLSLLRPYANRHVRTLPRFWRYATNFRRFTRRSLRDSGWRRRTASLWWWLARVWNNQRSALVFVKPVFEDRTRRVGAWDLHVRLRFGVTDSNVHQALQQSGDTHSVELQESGASN
jgi:hypothetical protein